MTNGDATTNEVIAELHRSIHAASHDYFVWSRGHILYDKGVEALVQIYSAKRLFEVFSQRYEVTVHLERSCNALVPGLSGRIDMTIEFDKGKLYAIEFKRYSNQTILRPDLARLREIVTLRSGIGLLAAPCYMKERERDHDWPLRQKRESEPIDRSELWHLSDSKELPNRGHADGWSHERALVIQIGDSP